MRFHHPVYCSLDDNTMDRLVVLAYPLTLRPPHPMRCCHVPSRKGVLDEYRGRLARSSTVQQSNRVL